MIFTALSYSQMSRRVPLAGSVFSYVGAGVHPNLGFFAGWVMLLDYLLVPTLLYVFAAESMVGIFPGTERWIWALVFVAINTIVNLAGVNSIKLMNRLFLIMELFFVAAFIVIAVTTLNGGTLPNAEWATTPMWNPSEVTAPLIAAALSIAVLSFLGFDGIATMAEESTGGHRSAGRAMIVSLIVVAVLFITQTWLASLLAGASMRSRRTRSAMPSSTSSPQLPPPGGRRPSSCAMCSLSASPTPWPPRRRPRACCSR